MFSEGAQRLLDALPDLAGLDRVRVRRLLSGAWLDAVRYRDFSGDLVPDAARDLRRLATALEVRLFVGGDLGDEPRRAAAFVAAECLGVVRDLSPAPDDPVPVTFGSVRRFETVEEALLYLTAGFDANAALTAAELERGEAAVETAVSEWTLARIRALLDHTRPVPATAAPDPDLDATLRDRVRHEIWQRAGQAVAAHVRWLRLLDDHNPAAAGTLRGLAEDLHEPDRAAAASHPDLHHLCLLLAGACDETSGRALRRVPSPPGDEGRFLEYQRARARRMPLLWPAAAAYADGALPGPRRHAVVTVPTGAGKSAVAELAAAQALQAGWVLYLAPTNALVAQIRRDLAKSIGGAGVEVRGLTGGAEFSVVAGETLELRADRMIAVMTPEKCSLALRQTPELFASLSLCVMDEAHLVGDQHSRGVVAELVLAEVLHRSPDVRVLLMSALVDNPGHLATWLEEATGTEAVSIDEPWRPTRTLRALCGIDAEASARSAAEAVERFNGLSAKRKNVKAQLPLRLLGALHGTWTGEDPGDYEIVDTGLTVEAQINRAGQIPQTGHTAPATRALTQALAEAGHRVLVFLPADRHLPFSYARDLQGPGADDARPEVASLLTLAEAEIAGPASGQVSAVRDALTKGIAVHTSAMTVEEQRASEIAFESGAATVMLATGTLAQGLNLPATAVVIGGTSVGDAREADTPDGRARAKAQLLNAIGRAGRAQTAARSLAVVVPAQPVGISQNPNVAVARNAAMFLADEDGSMRVTSRLNGLIAGTLSESLELTTMGVPEQTAFAFLSFTAESGDATAVLSRTLAAHVAGAAEQAERVTDALRALGRDFLDHERAAAWIATAAHRAGVTLPAAVALERPLRILLSSEQGAPTDVRRWARELVGLLMAVPLDVRLALFDGKHLDSTALQGIRSTDADKLWASGVALARTLDAWLSGRPLTEVGAALHGTDDPVGISRAKGAELPRTLRFVRDGIEHALTTVAGAAVAIVVTGVESDPQGPWALKGDALNTLGRLPVALRSGASSPAALTLLQAGLRPRVVAHLLARLAPPPDDLAADDLPRWARQILKDLETVEFVTGSTSDVRERDMLRAAAHVRSMS